MKPPKGYKQTELGILPDNWKVVRLDTITKIVAGGTPNTQVSQYWGGNIRWLNSGGLNNKIIYDTDGRITEEGLKKSSTKEIPKKCILVGLAGQGKTRGTIAINMIPLCINQSIAAIYPNSEIFHYKYLYFNLDNRYNELRQLSSGEGGRGGLNLKIISNLFIPLPPLKEQEKIAEILNAADLELSSYEKLIALKEKYKKGLMQKLLTPKIRFKEFKEQWKVVRLGEVLRERNTYAEKNGKYNHVSLTKDGIIPKSERYNRDFLVLKECKQYKITMLNDICYNPANLKFGVICKNDYGVGIFSPIYVTFEINDNYNINFISNILTQQSFIDKIRKYEEGTVYERKAVKPKDFLLGSIFIPKSLKEQQKIAEVLSSCDAEIQNLKDLCALLKKQKHALMQRLLSGKVRVKGT